MKRFLVTLLFFSLIINPIFSTRNPMQTFFIANMNLTKITWAHAVNSKRLLEAALNSDIMMFEADVVLGKLINQKTDDTIPIMGHPPVTTSDLSLEQFLNTVQLYNSHNTNDTRGIKLDFKTIEVFEKALEIISPLYAKMDFPVWINADILPGPLNATTKPVDPKRFFEGAKKFSNSILSIGWTTRYGSWSQFTTYTSEQIQNMLDVIKENNIEQSITFPVRAGIAAESLDGMQNLIDNVSNSTLTIWSSEGDPVNIKNLRNLIFEIGLNKVYVDVPEDLRNALHLDGILDYKRTSTK